ncbi:MAG: lysophospholipid acyltransferase family protein [Pirellulaceae bacterium]
MSQDSATGDASVPPVSSETHRRKKTPKGPVKRSLSKRVFYFIVRYSSQVVGVLVFGLRCHGREHLPDEGSGLVVSTHQSHFDPVLVGVTFNERLNYLARRSLFKNKLFGLLISMLDAIELDRDRSGLAGIKETMVRVRRGEKVLMFPEGTRTSTGRIAELKPGFISIARRCKAPLIPMAIVGAFEALPKGAKVPVRSPLRVWVGEPITPDEFLKLEDDELLKLVSQRLHSCDQRARLSFG